MSFRPIHTLAAALLLLASGFCRPAVAEDFLQTARTLWFNAESAPAVTASLNLRGISLADAQAVVNKRTRDLGAVTVTPRLVDGKRDGVTITFEGLTASSFETVDSFWKALEERGARGEWKDHPPQVEVRLPTTTDATTRAAFTANLSHPDHLKQIREFGGVAGNAAVAQTGELAVKLSVQDGSLLAPLQQAIGIYQVSAKDGAVVHDKWVRSTTGVDADMLPQLRHEFLRKRKGETSQSIVVRYLLGDAENKYGPGSEWSNEIGYHRPPIGSMRADQQGEKPLILRPGAAVWHQRVHHQNNILGDVNPALVNGDLVELLTSNKWFEALWLEKYLPGALSRTEHLREIVENEKLDPKDVSAMLAGLHKRFPKGWVLKAVKESHTGRFIVSDKLDIATLIAQYRRSDFNEFYKRAVIETAGQDEDNLNGKLQEHPAYLGWKIDKFLQNPEMVIAQERVDIASEFRVEGISGKVLGSFSTVDRYGHKVWKTERQLPTFTDPKIISAVEAYTQGLLDKLPLELRGTPFAFDIALLKDGSFRVIESNAGPESGYFVDFRYSVAAMDALLRRYQREAEAGKLISKGMTPRRMSAYLNGLVREWKIDPKLHWPHANVRNEFDVSHPHTVEVQFETSTLPKSFFAQSPPKPLPCHFPGLSPRRADLQVRKD